MFSYTYKFVWNSWKKRWGIYAPLNLELRNSTLEQTYKLGAQTIANWVNTQYPFRYNDWVNIFTKMHNGYVDPNTPCIARDQVPDGVEGIFVSMYKDHIYFDTEFFKQYRVLLTYEQMMNFLRQYGEFLKTDYRAPYKKPTMQTSIEYIAEGIKAQTQYRRFLKNSGFFIGYPPPTYPYVSRLKPKQGKVRERKPAPTDAE